MKLTLIVSIGLLIYMQSFLIVVSISLKIDCYQCIIIHKVSKIVWSSAVAVLIVVAFFSTCTALGKLDDAFKFIVMTSMIYKDIALLFLELFMSL
jgi:hypothetical protein